MVKVSLVSKLLIENDRKKIQTSATLNIDNQMI